MKILVMGGTRFMGKATVSLLASRGHELTLFNRGTNYVEWDVAVHEIHGDRNDSNALVSLREHEFDLAVDFSAYTAQHTEMLLAVLRDTAHVVHLSSGAVYAPRPELPWDENAPYGPWPLWGEYGRGKLGCERALFANETEGRRIALRLPYVLGPENYADREEFVLNRLLDDAEVLLPDGGQAVIQFISAAQVAQSVERIVDRLVGGRMHEETRHIAFNIASPNCLTTLEGFVELCAELAGVQARIRSVPGDHLNTSTPLDPASLVFPFPNVSYVLGLDRAGAEGVLPEHMSLPSMIEDSHEALIAAPARRSWLRTAAEDAVLGAAI